MILTKLSHGGTTTSSGIITCKSFTSNNTLHVIHTNNVIIHYMKFIIIIQD